MSRPPSFFLVAYDIRDEKRLRQVYRVMRGFGDHIQYSVFRCLLSDTQTARLHGKLIEIINAAEDQVMFVPLGSSDAGIYTLGQAMVHMERVVRIL
jgi:CRISPR-associated protein Cas2